MTTINEKLKYCYSCRKHHPITKFTPAYEGMDISINFVCDESRAREKALRLGKLNDDPLYCVYFIQVAPDGPIKIGVAGNVKNRLKELQVGCPFLLKILAAIPTLSYLAKETELHRQFRDERIRGEWFNPSEKLLKYIASNAIPYEETH